MRFSSHLISIWHRDASKQASVDGILATVLAELPAELQPKPDQYFYKKHSDHASFKHPAQEAIKAKLRDEEARKAAQAAQAAQQLPEGQAQSPAPTGLGVSGLTT